ncbi:TPA: S49 family peptidase [Klebsiella variicola]|uniref:S49 family peptidase n=1 Tax=Klebsiella quasipneumoniae TaxID=1463165 RepID=UPI002B1B6A20|nr:S49 family peptidase [Klebsiella variicola]
MARNLAHIASQAFNEPLLMEPAYARVFFSALGSEIGADRLTLANNDENLDTQSMRGVTASFMEGGRKAARLYRVVDGIAILPVTGSLVHRLGGVHPFSGMTGYDGIIARLNEAINDQEVRGVLLDIDSPGGQVAGAFDCADIIARCNSVKPVWALANDMACSAAMLIASACSRRLITQTGRMGSVGVLMAHADISEAMKKSGREITLIFSGSHKVDGNPYARLPDDVRDAFKEKMDQTRQLFAARVAEGTGMTLQAVLDTEAAVYDGLQAVNVGLADEVVNSADAVACMAEALEQKNNRGRNMSQLQASTDATAERDRVLGILQCSAAKGRESLAQALAAQPGMSVEAAEGILLASPLAHGTGQSLAEQISELPEAKGREALASALADTPNMTIDQARQLLAASPAGQRAEGGELKSQIMALPEAKGRDALAQELATLPSMTPEKAKTLLACAPKYNAVSGADQFAAHLATFGAQSPSASVADEDGGDVAVARLGSFFRKKGE